MCTHVYWRIHMHIHRYSCFAVYGWLMSKNSRSSIYNSARNLHSGKNESMPELGLVAVDWDRDGSLHPAAAFLDWFFVLAVVCLFLIIICRDALEPGHCCCKSADFHWCLQGDSDLHPWPSGWGHYYGVFGLTDFTSSYSQKEKNSQRRDNNKLLPWWWWRSSAPLKWSYSWYKSSWMLLLQQRL